MNKLELMEKRQNKLTEMNAIVERAKTEKRELIEPEKAEFESLESDIKTLDIELRNNDNKEKNTNKMEDFSLFRELNSTVKSDEQKQLRSNLIANGIQLNTESVVIPFTRSLIPVGGEGTIGTQVNDLLGQLVEGSIINKMGARILTNLTSDFAIPSISNASMGWAGDGVASADMGAVINTAYLKSKRVGGYINVDKKLLLQGAGVESALLQTVFSLVNTKVGEALFSTSAATDRPSGLFAVASGATFTVAATAVTYANILALEAKMLENNVDASNCVIVTTPAIAAKLKATAKSATGIYSPILADGKIDQYDVIVSNQVAAGHICMIDKTQVWCGVYAIEVEKNPYTQMKNGLVEICVNAYLDATVSNSKAYCFGKLS